MTLNRFVAAIAVLFGIGSLALAAGPVVLRSEQPTPPTTAIPVHETCHENYRNHGGNYPDHYHRQSDCRVIIAEDEGGGYDDCHRDVSRHYVDGYGDVWHRHRGSSCRVEIYEEDSAGGSGCIKVGPVSVCP